MITGVKEVINIWKGKRIKSGRGKRKLRMIDRFMLRVYWAIGVDGLDVDLGRMGAFVLVGFY